MDARQQEAMVKALQDTIPGLSGVEARTLLSAHNWDITALFEGAPGGENFYIGGGDGSGQQVLAPTSHTESGGSRRRPGAAAPDMHAVMEELVTKASQDAGEGEDAGEGASQGRMAFFGTGRRLGHTANISPAIAATLREEREATVSMYANGYVIDDGPLLSYESPNGRAFFAALKEGRVPQALAAAHPGADVSMRVRDCLGEEFTPPPVTAFQGTGHRLQPDAQGSTAPPRERTFNADRTFELRAEEESTTVRIMDSFGKPHDVHVNPDRHTVEDLYYLAHTVQPEVMAFDLVTRDRPPRTLDESTRDHTITAEKLKRCIVVMKLL